MFWGKFTDQWLMTRAATRIFFASTLLVLAFTASPWFGGSVSLNGMNFWQRLPWGIFGLTVPLAIPCLLFGMWTYWTRLDRARPWVKRAWFVVLLIGLWWGSCLYCLCVYLPQVRRATGKTT